MLPNQKLALVTICDNAFALLLAALLKSIEKTLQTPARFDLYLVDDGISAAAKARLLQTINPALFDVHWLTVDEAIPAGTYLPVDRSTFPRNVFVRLFIPYFIPAEVTRVVYLDVDMIANQDITALWSVDLGDKLLGAVVDRAELVSSSWGGYKNYRELGLAPETRIFNSGMLVIDPIAWRRQEVTKRVIKCIEYNVEYAVFPDQYGLNVVLANQWLELDRGWNCYAHYADEKPHLIHFTGVKPIYTSYDLNKAYQETFYRYLRQTPWHDFTPISGWNRLLIKQTHKLKKRLYRLADRLHVLPRPAINRPRPALSQPRALGTTLAANEWA